MTDKKATFETFFQEADLNPNADLITGTICGYKIKEVENPLTRRVRYLNKLVDELAKGKKMNKILRSWYPEVLSLFGLPLVLDRLL